ncbi:manganese efflux pump [bacterium]|nr:manganese efflux pump [candidate division CSSED10-310 bacterium]
MSFWDLLLLAIALAADAFSVGAAVGLRHNAPRQVFRLSFHFGLFQALMPLFGALAGHFIFVYIERWDHWIAFGLLCIIGIKMIVTSFHSDDEYKDIDLTRGLSLVALSVAVSIDALAAGLSLSATNTSLTAAVVTIGVVAALATLIAMLAANRIHARIGRKCEFIAGFVLIFLGFRILYSHMM